MKTRFALRMALLTAIVTFGALLFGSRMTLAAPVVDRIPNGVMPGHIEAYLLNCGGTNNAAAQTGWVSLRGRNTETVVDLGNTTTRTIDLQYNTAGIVCRAGSMGGLASTTNGIVGPIPDNYGIVGQTSSYSYGGNTGDYSTGNVIPFTYTASAAFTVSTDINIAVVEKRIHTYNVSTRYRCVTNPGDSNPRSPTSSTDFRACASSAAPIFTIRVNVPPQNIPIGVVDAASCEQWSGWTFDADRSGASLAVHVYIDAPAGTTGATFVGEFPANVSRPDVNTAYGIGGSHGYAIDVPAAYQFSSRRIYVYAIGIDATGARDGNNAYLGSRAYNSCPITPSMSCTIGNVAIIAGQSASVTVTVRHGGPTGAPTATYSGTLTIRGQSDESLSGSLSSGTSAARTGTSRTYAAPGTYAARATFSYSSSSGNGSFNCSGNVEVAVPPPTVSCDVTNVVIEEGATTSVQINIRHQGPPYAPTVSFSAAIAISSQPSQTMTGSVSNGSTATLTSTARTYNAPGRYAVTVSVNGTAGSYSVATGCSGLVNANSRPYVRTYGNDVLAGSGFGASCTAGTGSIQAFNRGSAAGFAGSGANLGVFARSTITGFRSASTRADAGIVPYALSFANTDTANVTPASGLFGGAFGNTQCLPDYWSDNLSASFSTAQVVNLATLTTGRYVYRQNVASVPVVITGVLPAGAKVAIYVDGNAVIRGGGSARVGYGDGPWGAVTDVPSLYVIARGDIGIAHDITTLDGQYIAQHTDAGRGRITTCVNAATLAPFATDALFLANCRTKLVINGTFSARKVNLLRAFSSTRFATAGESAAASSASEVFVFTPEVYMGAQGSVGRRTQTYDSITALPPAL